MKKVLVALTALILVIGTALGVSAAAESPVKDYASAKDGDVLYTVNFKGDSAFKPKVLGDNENLTYTASADGSALTVKGKETDKTRNYWGGKIEGLTVSKDTVYTMVYKVNATASPVKNNSLGIGGVVVAETGYEGSATESKNEPIFYNNYSNHNIGVAADQRSALSNPQKIGNYVQWNTLSKKFVTDSDGFMTMALTFDGESGKFTSYYLIEDEKWVQLERQSFEFKEGTTMGFVIYGYYQVINTTIKDVKIYKGAVGSVFKKADETTKAPAATTTKAPETTKAPAATTKAPETYKVSEKSGCGSSVAVTGIALVATIGTCTVFACKKRKED